MHRISNLRRFMPPEGVTSRLLAYREGTRALYEVSPELYALLDSPDAGTLEPALARQLDAEFDRLDARGFWYGPDEIPDLKGMRLYALNLAHVCNLACSYCNVNQGNYTGDGPTLATRKIVDRSLDRIPELFGDKRPEIVFYGGEPMIVWDALVYGVERAIERGLSDGFRIVTNGTLITAERAAFFARHEFHATVSIDGPPELQDTYRRTVGDKPSSAKVEAGVRHLREAGVEFALRATWAVDREVSYTEVRRYLAELAGDPLKVAIGLEFQGRPEAGDDAERFLGELGEMFRAVAENPEGKHLPGTSRAWADALFRADISQPSGCPAGKTSFLVTPGGNIHPCQVAAAGGALKMGTVHDGMESDGADAATQALTHERLCPGCWFEPICQQNICPLGGPVPEDYFTCVQFRHEFTGLLALLDRIGYDAMARNQIHVPGVEPAKRLMAERMLAMRNLVAAVNHHIKPMFYAPIGLEARTRRRGIGPLQAVQMADGLAGEAEAASA